MNILAASEVSLFDMNSWWWAIERGMYWVISAIQKAYNYLVGITPISNSADGPDVDMSNDVLFNLFNDSKITKVFLIFAIFAVLLMGVFLIIGFIKVHFKNEDQLASRGKMVGKSLSAMLTMLLLPLIFFIAIYFIGFFFSFLASTMNHALGTTGGETDIASIIHSICLPEGVSDMSLPWDSSYDEFKKHGAADGYNYVLGMLTSGILIYVLLATCLTLVERLIDVIGLYIIGPFALARSPLDDGASFNLWRDLVLTKLLSAGGVIIFMYLYFMLLGNVMAWFKPLETDGTAVQAAKGMVQVLFIIGGAFSVKKGALVVSQMISQNAGVSEGMSQSQSLHMLSSGLRLGAGAIFGAASKMGQGAAMGMRGISNSGGQAMRGAMSAQGGANIPIKAGDGNMMNRMSPIGGAMGAQGGANIPPKAGDGNMMNRMSPIGGVTGAQGGANIPPKAGDGNMMNSLSPIGGAMGAQGGANIPPKASDGKIMRSLSSIGGAMGAQGGANIPPKAGDGNMINSLSSIGGVMGAQGGANIPPKASDGNMMRSMSSGVDSAMNAQSGANTPQGGANTSAKANASNMRNSLPTDGGGAMSEQGGANIPTRSGDGNIMNSMPMIGGAAGAEISAMVQSGGDGMSSGANGAVSQSTVSQDKTAKKQSNGLSAKQALLKGGVFGIAGYGAAKAAGAVVGKVKNLGGAIGGKIKMTYQNSNFARNRAGMREAKNTLKQDKRNDKQAGRDTKSYNKTSDKLTQKYGLNQASSGKLQASIKRDLDSIAKVNEKIQSKYGNRASTDQISKMQDLANENRFVKMEQKMNKLKSITRKPDSLGKRFAKDATDNKESKDGAAK